MSDAAEPIDPLALPPILSTAQAAQLLDCEDETAEVAAREGRLAGVKYGRSWVFPTAAFLSALNAKALADMENRANKPTPKPAGVGRPEAANEGKLRRNPRAQPRPNLDALLGVEPGSQVLAAK